jgi:cellulose synthase/poly-beta-1,6-N-acetylglucosamine synthase-like glycosyltransferase
MLDWAMALPLALIFVVFTNRYFFGLFLRFLHGEPEDEKAVSYTPTVCVIIPMYNEGQSIFDTLRSLSAQDYEPTKMKIVVVDDMSKDDSAAWAEKAAALDPRIRVERNPRNLGKRLGIARAVRMTDAEIVVSVDSDVIVYPEAVRRLVRRFTSPKIAAVGGRVLVSNAQENWLTKMQAIKYYFGYQYLKNVERTLATVMCLSGCLTAYRRRVLIELEPVLESRNLLGVPIKYGEDRFLTRQIVKRGYSTCLDLDAVCRTKAPPTLSGYFSQQLRWRRSNLVDFFGGVTHAIRLHPLVALHYLSLNALLLVYPAVLWMALLNGSFMPAATMHLGILAIYAGVYAWNTRHDDPTYRVAPVHFLWMGFIMPVTYMVLSILAFFTLHSSSWETRSKPAEPKTQTQDEGGIRYERA